MIAEHWPQMNRLAITISVVAAATIVFAACGNSGGYKGGSAPKLVLNSADQAWAQGISLKLKDLPTGWVENNAQRVSRPSRCNINSGKLVETGRINSPRYLSPRTQSRRVQISSAVGVYQDKREARLAFARSISHTYMQCSADYIVKGFEASGIHARNTVRAPYAFAQLGDESRAYYLVLRFQNTKQNGPGAVYQMIYIQRGRVVVELTMISTFFDPSNATMKNLAEILAKRMAKG